MEEFWKEIRGYEGLYEVSNLGRVRRTSIYGSGILRRSTTKILNGKTCKPVKVENILTKEITTHRNMTDCALFYGTSRIQLRRCIRNNKLLNNILKVKEL